MRYITRIIHKFTSLSILSISLSIFTFCPSSSSAQPGPSFFVPLTPCRVFDSRQPSPPSQPPFAPESTHFITVKGLCNIPQTANSIAATIIAVGAVSGGYITIYESSILLPPVSTMNFRGAGADSSASFIRLCYPAEECSSDIAIYVSGSATHVIIDVVGYTELLPSEFASVETEQKIETDLYDEYYHTILTPLAMLWASRW